VMCDVLMYPLKGNQVVRWYVKRVVM